MGYTSRPSYQTKEQSAILRLPHDRDSRLSRMRSSQSAHSTPFVRSLETQHCIIFMSKGSLQIELLSWSGNCQSLLWGWQTRSSFSVVSYQGPSGGEDDISFPKSSTLFKQWGLSGEKGKSATLQQESSHVTSYKFSLSKHVVLQSSMGEEWDLRRKPSTGPYYM